MHPSDISDKVWIGFTVTMHTLAIAMGSFRLIHRYRTKLYHWDDLGVAGCLICNVVFFSVLCTLKRALLTEDLKETRQPRFWLLWLSLSSIQWTSRMSIGFTTLRLIKFDIWRKRLTIAVLVVFTLAWMLIILDFIIECNVNVLPHHNCSSSVAEIVACSVFITADVFLVYIPLHLLRNLRQPRGTRFMVRVAFCVSGISTVANIMNMISEFYEGPQHEMMAQFLWILAAPIALIVCSSIVVIPFVYRLFMKEEDWMISIPIDIVVSDEDPSAVSLPERVTVREPTTRSFATLPLPFSRRSFAERGQLHSWPQRSRIEDKPAMLITDVVHV
ncbi:hypothetical protein JOM56_007157 [Amanita muscaria]